jgi:small subunit ribosomal protein S15
MATKSAAGIEKKITELAKTGKAPAQIGLALRDQEGVPDVKAATGKKISQILEDNNIEYKKQIDLTNENIEKIKTHIEKNKHDYPAQRALTKQLWALKK